MIKEVYRASLEIAGGVKKALYKNSVYSYWWIGKKNFGDLVTPSLFRVYGMKAVHKSIDKADVISTGSILQRVSGSKYKGIILGSGIIRDEEKLFPNATILAVRGPLTANRIKAPANVLLADPGILLSDLIRYRQKKKYKLGIIPHFQDKNHSSVIEFVKKNKGDVLYIDVQNNPEQVVKEADKCEFIISSSLHGLITADSLGIPNLRISTSENASGGGNFKFEDYHSSISRDSICHMMNGNESVNDLIEKTDIKLAEIDQCKASMKQAISEMKRLLFDSKIDS
jgi:pyruvyltransferase